MNKCIRYLETPIGILEIIGSDNFVDSIMFVSDIKENIGNGECSKAYTQLNEYFLGSRKTFDLNLNVDGTSFQQLSWDALRTIPYGKTINYKDQAVIIKKPNASRAVGNANSKNKFTIVIPCHRVIGKNKELRGYNNGITKKAWLLEHEKKNG
jgi:methylated-DNA-[protein]-cysteine S-methyltransferase